MLAVRFRILRAKSTIYQVGLFLTFSIVINKTQQESVESIQNYAALNNGGLDKVDIEYANPNFCSISSIDTKSVITYPSYFSEYIHSSEYLSQKLQTSVYTFTIYDGDFWMLYFFENGKLTSRFNPFPDYWVEKEDREQLETWNFDLNKFCKDFYSKTESVDKYFIEWKQVKKKTKAYKSDEFYYGDCMQVFDLIKEININYSDIINYEKQSETFKLWTTNFPLQENPPNITFDDLKKAKRYTKNYLKLSPEEIEMLLGIDYDWFIESSTKNQLCLKCNARDTEREDLEYFLSIDEFLIKTTGHCKNCGKR